MSDPAVAAQRQQQRQQGLIAGLVERQSCSEDQRGTWAVLTDTGWQTLVDAAPAHVASVREHLVDVLTPAELAAFGNACRKIAAALQPTTPSSGS